MKQERADIIHLINDARASGARQSKAGEVIGISSKTYQRWIQPENESDRRLYVVNKPVNKLSDIERQRIIRICNATEYADLLPSKLVPRLADQGIYLACESTIYRILKEEKQMKHRLKSKLAKTINKSKSLVAVAPNQIYTWEITYLPTTVKGLFYYLYLVMDIYSARLLVGKSMSKNVVLWLLI